MDCLLLRFEAPLMSFGGPAVDQYRRTEAMPGLSMITGLVANALGWHHRDIERLQSLQSVLRFGARRDRAGQLLTDFQTVDLGQPHLLDSGWTTLHRRELRMGQNGKGTHIRYQQYWADACFLVALTLDPSLSSNEQSGDEKPDDLRASLGIDLDTIDRACRKPARPLFLGRKTCLPTSPLHIGVRASRNLEALLATYPRIHPRADDGPLSTWFPFEDVSPNPNQTARHVTRYDLRDWRNGAHVGNRLMQHTLVDPPPFASHRPDPLDATLANDDKEHSRHA